MKSEALLFAVSDNDFFTETSEDSRLPVDLLFFGLTTLNYDVVTSDKGMRGMRETSFIARGIPATASASVISTLIMSEYNFSEGLRKHYFGKIYKTVRGKMMVTGEGE